MLSRSLRIGTCLTLGFLAAAPTHAQESSWTVHPFAEGGWSFPLMNLGKNAVDNLPQTPALQTVASIEGSPVMAAGVEVLFPNGNMRFRGEFRTTVGATARALLGLCESGKVVQPGVGLCAIVERADARVTDGDVGLILSLGQAEHRIRPLAWVGLGVRSYDFDSDLSECDGYSDESLEICRRSREIFENPSVTALLTFGTGLEARLDPVSAFVRLSAVTSSYSGGGGRADGGKQVDLVLTGGLGLKVR